MVVAFSDLPIYCVLNFLDSRVILERGSKALDVASLIPTLLQTHSKCCILELFESIAEVLGELRANEKVADQDVLLIE